MGRGRDYELRIRGNSTQASAAADDLASSIQDLVQLQQRANTVAQEYARSVALTSKEATALGRAMNLTGKEARDLVKAEKLAADDAKRLAQAQMEADRATRGLGQAANDSASSLQTLVGGLQAAGAAAIVQQIGQGIEALYELRLSSENATNALNEFTNGQADRYVEAVTTATGGMVSAFDAAQISANLTGMGLAQTSDQVAEMTRVATILGKTFKNLGAADAANEFSLLMANMSFLRLDQFGISSAAVRDRIRELKAETPGLTQEIAFYQAVMEIGGATADRVAGSMSDEAVAAAQLEAAWADLRVEIANNIPLVNRFHQGLTGLVVGVRDLIQTERDFRQTAGATSQTLEEYAAQLHSVGMLDEDLARLVASGADTQELYNAALENGDTQMLQAIAGLQALTDEYERNRLAATDAAEKGRALAFARRDEADAAGEAALSEEELARAEEEAEAAQRQAEQAARAYTQALQDQLREQQALIRLAGEQAAALGTLGVQGYLASAESGQGFLDFLRATGSELLLTGDALNEYLLSQGLATQAQIESSETMARMDQLLQDQRISVEDAIAAWELLAAGQTEAANALLQDASTIEGAEERIRAYGDSLIGTGEVAQEQAATVAGAQQQVLDQAQQIADAQALIEQTAAPAFGAIAENAPPANQAMGPLARKFTAIVDALTAMPGLAAESFAATNAAAGLYVGGETGLGLAAAMIASMRNSWQYLLTHPNLDLSVKIDRKGEIPNVAGGGSFTTHGPQLLLVGDNPGGVEHVVVTPISGRGVTHGIPGGLAMAGGGDLVASGGGRGTISIGQIVVQTAATDARGIAEAIFPALRQVAHLYGLDFAEVA